MPETRYEVVAGEVVYVSPADPPHATRHSKLSALLEAYCADDHVAACDMLTRTSEKEDFAPDGSIYPAAPDPETGGRQLEALAFEVVSTQTLGDAGRKASSLVDRGVRRVFALDIERERALEWSRQTDAWEILAEDATIDDPALVMPLPIYDLVKAASADDAVARALLAKNNPVLVEAMTSARAEGKAEGKADAVLAVLEGRGLAMSEAERERIAACRDDEALSSWLVRAGTCASVGEMLEG